MTGTKHHCYGTPPAQGVHATVQRGDAAVVEGACTAHRYHEYRSRPRVLAVLCPTAWRLGNSPGYRSSAEFFARTSKSLPCPSDGCLSRSVYTGDRCRLGLPRSRDNLSCEHDHLLRPWRTFLPPAQDPDNSPAEAGFFKRPPKLRTFAK